MGNRCATTKARIEYYRNRKFIVDVSTNSAGRLDIKFDSEIPRHGHLFRHFALYVQKVEAVLGARR